MSTNTLALSQRGKLTAQISALRAPRNIRTRGLTLAVNDPTVERTARIAGILREICQELDNYKGTLVFYLFLIDTYLLLIFYIQINLVNIS